MSRYHSTSQYAQSGIADQTIQEAARADLARHDRDDSPSDSESSAAFNTYADGPTDDQGASDDPYHALTSQTLNADGTPKRPMNAFMIFARKRRPQISAANQMMRTGDVSKILSKEWNSMEMSEKKFYLDQAKKLKDNFNSKYPDYVYRRRPNNSRKKRKAEPSHDDPTDGTHMGDPDDPGYEDTSPIDGEDALMIPSPQDVQYTRSHALNPSPPMYHSHDAVVSSAAPGCTYPYSSDFHTQHSAPTSRISHLGHSESTLGSNNLGSLRATSVNDVGALSHGYNSQPLYQNPLQPLSSLYAHAHSHTPHHTHPAHGLWEPGRGPAARSDNAARSNWPVLPALDINLARQRASIPVPVPNGTKSDPYSPQLPARPWSSATSSTASSSSSASTSQHYATTAGGPGPSPNANANAFPTLNSAFFPNESPASKPMDLASPGANAGTASAHARTPASSQDYFSHAQLQGGALAGSGGPGRRLSATGGTADQAAAYGQYGSPVAGWNQQYRQPTAATGVAAGSAGSRGGGGVPGHHSQSISPYSLQQTSPGEGGGARSAAAAAAAAASGAPLGYWDDRFGGR